MPSRWRRRRSGLPSPAPSSTVLLLVVILFVLASFSILAPPLLETSFMSRKPSDSRGENILRFHSRVADSEDFDLSRGDAKFELWGSKRSANFYGCSNSSIKFATAEVNTQPNRYLMIATSGGLNQQRTGITDGVVVARILNATLVIPKLDGKSFWRDASKFSEIFDVDWFISSLSKDIKILKQLPEVGGKVISNPYTMRVPRKCSPRCYLNRVLPVLWKKKVVQLTKFDYRLSNKLEDDLQKLRCRVNYHALRFTDAISAMGNTLIERMKSKGKHFIALHLRFEPDMLAFSGCYYGGGDKERRELGRIRSRWKTLHVRNPERERRNGRCPLTPEEVGLMLRALGYGRDVHVYVASGVVYGGDESLKPLKALFSHLHSKESLATEEELKPFSAFSSRMAALDFIVCDGSDTFVTNNNGNMAKILAGKRRYFGHKRTIRPNTKKLYSLLPNWANTTWEAFSSKVRSYQRGFMGEPREIRPGRGEFHENPSTCICENHVASAEIGSKKTKKKRSGKEEDGKGGNVSNDNMEEAKHDDPEDYVDARGAPANGGSATAALANGTGENLFGAQTEELEVEDMLSD